MTRIDRNCIPDLSFLSPCLRLARQASSLLLLPLCLQLLWGCGEPRVVVTQYDPARTSDGYTYFTSRAARRIVAVDMTGIPVVNFPAMDHIAVGSANGMEVQPDGTVAYLFGGKPMMADPVNYEILYEGPDLDAHHSITMTPQGTLMFLSSDPFDVDYEPWYPATCAQGDFVREIDTVTDQVVWEWRLRDYLDPIQHHHPSSGLKLENGCIDWSHGNTVKFIPDYVYNGRHYQAVLYNAAALNTFWMIDYPSGNVLWSCGQHGDFGQAPTMDELLFAPAHEVKMLQNNLFLLFDNGTYRSLQRSRAIKIQVDPVAGQADIVWSWTEPFLYDWWGGDADELPNGNILVTSTTHGRLIEVTLQGDVVWNAYYLAPWLLPYSIYQSQRVPY